VKKSLDFSCQYDIINIETMRKEKNMSDFFETTIENGIHEIDIEIEFDYQPYEPMTRHYPGCNEDLDFCGFTMLAVDGEMVDSSEIEIIDDDLLDQLRVAILEHRAEENEMAQYGYMLDYERI
jgi:hypothetical protein